MKLHRATGWLLLVLLCLAVVFSPGTDNTRWSNTLHDAAHGPIFGCIALLALYILRTFPGRRLSAWAQYAWAQYTMALAFVAFLGLATEIAQGFVGRDVSLTDAAHDVLGAGAFLTAFRIFDGRLPRLTPHARIAAVAGAGLLLAFLAMPVARSAMKYHARNAAFPVLADFSRVFDRYFFLARDHTLVNEIVMPAQWARWPGERAVRIEFLDGDYPGFDIVEPAPDWSAYRTLFLDVTNAAPSALEVLLRIHDVQHDDRYQDRFNKAYELPARTRTVLRIPLSEVQSGPAARLLDLRRIAAVVLFRIQPSTVHELYFTRAWLE